MPSTYDDYGIIVDPIRYNSQCITFTEWIALLTLCFAPLITHVASGAPTPTYLTYTRPRWYDHLSHYNPTSIIWRYAAITDRRIRATSWSRHDLAASNAVFWTSAGWDGREKMVRTAAPYCVRCPDTTHAQILSLMMFKTIITTMQGVAALWMVIGGDVGTWGVDTVFNPLAILGLLRLCAAVWLTDDFGYQSYEVSCNGVQRLLMRRRRGGVRDKCEGDSEVESMEERHMLDPFLVTPLPSIGFKEPASCWKSWIFRGFFLLIMLGIWGITGIRIIPVLGAQFFTTTAFFLSMFYFVFLTISLLLYAFYFFRGRTTTTLIPCISSMWYRLYTLFVFAGMLALIVISSVETNKQTDGRYGTYGPRFKQTCPAYEYEFNLYGDMLAMESVYDGGRLGPGQVQVVAGNVTLKERFYLYNFTGYCVGQLL